MTHRLRRLLRSAVTWVALLALLAGACSQEGGELTIQATFDDVIDLVPKAHVRAGDVPIGIVTDIELTDDLQALVTMEVQDGTGLPHETEAVLAKTSMLGERYIDLRPAGEGGSLEDGQLITDTSILTDFEDLVRSGNDLLAFVAADRLGAAVQTGAVAFGGRGSLLSQFVTDLEVFVGRYEGGKDDLVRLIEELDGYTDVLADNAQDNADAFAELARFSQALEEEDDRLLDALDDLTRLAVVGERILANHREEIDGNTRRLRILLQQLVRIDGALQNFLTWIPRHNEHVPNGVVDFEGQVWLDFILCGENDDQNDPSEDCTPDNPGEPTDNPGYHPFLPECWEDHANCPGESRDEREGG
ncbi:MAG: MCE family protein [Nitriliruptorales bacterium]|nr:MCE family protein [Nitriliruptorales bacterium]